MSSTEIGTIQYVSFFLDESLLGVNVMRVQELLPPQQMTIVPQASRDIRGLLNLRGNIVPAIDLRLRIGLKEQTDLKSAMNVIVRCEDGLKSLLVDRIGDVLDLQAASLEPSPRQDGNLAAAFTDGVHQLDNDLLLVLNIDRICNRVAENGAKD